MVELYSCRCVLQAYMTRKKSKGIFTGKSGQDNFHKALVVVVFAVTYIFWMMWGFISNCVFEWPVRFDAKTCWNEQKTPAQQKAIDAASPLI